MNNAEGEKKTNQKTPPKNQQKTHPKKKPIKTPRPKTRWQLALKNKHLKIQLKLKMQELKILNILLCFEAA